MSLTRLRCEVGTSCSSVNVEWARPRWRACCRSTWREAGKAVIAPRINCDDTDTFTSLWRKVLHDVEYRRRTGFDAEAREIIHDLSEEFRERPILPSDVKRILTEVGKTTLLVAIIDEFDRVTGTLRAQFSDTIKALSDHSVPATIVVVGVADTVDGLIRKHESIERALAQVRMPRMSGKELEEAISLGLEEVGMEMGESARKRIVRLSQGLPHYAHLVSLHAARAASRDDRTSISIADVGVGVREAVKNAQESIVAIYHRAVMSRSRDSLYGHVALACALARLDDRGFFQASAVRSPMSVLMNKECDILAFARHMNDFCEAARGPILTRIGTPRNYRYRFINPLLPPFVIMDGFSKGLLDDDKLSRLELESEP